MRSWFALTLLGGFVAIVIAEALLVPGLTWTRHMISEYVHARDGALMVCGFLAWAGSLALTADIARRDRALPGRLALAALLALACLGMCITAAFATQTSAGKLPPGVHLTVGGRLHDLGSGLTSLALFAAAILSYRLVALRRVAVFTVLFALCADVGLLALGSAEGGLRQRLLVAAGCAWQGAFLRLGSRRSGAARGRVAD